MSLDALEVHRVAALARLRLSAGEERLFAEQLGRVIDHVDKIRTFETSAVPLASGAPSVEAADEPGPGLDAESFRANAPASRGPFLLVPKVIGSGDG